MIQIIHGLKGSGKTKKILEAANSMPEKRNGDVIFVDKDNAFIYDLRHEVRYVDASEYKLSGPDELFGFFCGMLSQNFDISVILVDAFLKLIKVDAEATEGFFRQLEELSAQHNVDFILSVAVDDEHAPEFMKKYFI